MLPPAPDVRIARTPAELARIRRLRYEVYIAEMGKPYPQANHHARELRDALDAECEHYYVERAGRIVGAARAYFGPPPHHLVEVLGLSSLEPSLLQPFHLASRLVVDAATRGTSVAWELTKALYLHGRLAGVTRSFLHCAPRLTRLYERLGYVACNEPFQDPVVGTQVPMVLAADDEEMLARVRSPFLPLAVSCRQGGAAFHRTLSNYFPNEAWH